LINIWTILLSLLIFGVLIAVHEAGHYISARLCKVGVTEFSIGMGPLILKKQGRNTFFTLRALPIGGYCKIVGETDEEDSQDSINSKSKLVRAFIFSAGSIMNLLTAYVFFAIAFVIVGIPTTTVGSFTQGYPAELSGMQTGDKILMIDDTKIDQWEDISLALADANATQSLSVQVYRESTDEYLTFKIKPAYVEDEERYILGVQAATTKNIFKALANAGALVWTYIKLILSTFIGLIRGLVGIDAFTGPIGVVSIVSDMASYGVAAVFQIAAAISISLGIINMLPIPALDGSRVFLLLVEAIKGSPIKKERENVFHFIGFALMILLAIVIAYNDIIRFF
jgi:regulator of sigma E protease